MGQNFPTIEDKSKEEKAAVECRGFENTKDDFSFEFYEKLSQRIEKYLLRIKDEEGRFRFNPPKHFREAFYVDTHQKIHQIIFFDCGRNPLKKFKDLEELFKELPDRFFETTVSDPEHDLILKDFLSTIHQKYKIIKPEEYDEKPEYHRKIGTTGKGLIEDVSEFYGGLEGPQNEKRCLAKIKEIQLKNMSNIIYLGQLKGNGICRHRSILYKLCCDILGIPCRILRGTITLEYEKYGKTVKKVEAHMWNEIVVDKENIIVDCNMYSTFFKDQTRIPSFVKITYQNLGHPLRYLKCLDNTSFLKDQKTIELLRKNYKNKTKEIIGHGGFGVVLEFKECDVVTTLRSADEYSTEKQDLAVKEVDLLRNLSTIQDKQRFKKIGKYVEKEIRLMHLLKSHPNIVKILGSFRTKKKVHVVMKKYDYDLSQILQKIFPEEEEDGEENNEEEDEVNPFENVPKQQLQVEILILLLEIAKGLKYIHSFGFTHFDVKLQNILVNLNEQNEIQDVVICDFGSCKQSNLHSHLTTVGALTREICPPEIKEVLNKLDNKEKEEKIEEIFQFSNKIDIYSFGLIMKEFGKFYCCEEFKKIEKECLKRNPFERISLDKIISHLKSALERKKNEPILRIKSKQLFNESNQHYKNGEYELSKQGYEKCLEIRLKCYPKISEEISDCYYNLGDSKSELHDFLSSSNDLYECLEIQKKLFKTENHEKIAECYSQIGYNLMNQKYFSKSEEMMKKGLKIRKKIFPENHSNIAESYGNLGTLFQQQQNYSESLKYYKKCLQIKEETLEKDDLKLAMSYNNIGIVYDILKEYSTALNYYQKSLKIRQKKLPPNHPDIAMSYNNMGIVYRNNSKKALEYHQEALKIRLISLPKNHPNIIGSYQNIGIVYEFKLKDYPTALEWYQKGGIKLQEHINRVKRKMN